MVTNRKNEVKKNNKVAKTEAVKEKNVKVETAEDERHREFMFK